MNEAVLAGAATARAKLVFADNLYMYTPPAGGPLTEDAPQRPTSRKGAVRKALADRGGSTSPGPCTTSRTSRGGWPRWRRTTVPTAGRGSCRPRPR
jgi:hypothetical protein